MLRALENTTPREAADALSAVAEELLPQAVIVDRRAPVELGDRSGPERGEVSVQPAVVDRLRDELRMRFNIFGGNDRPEDRTSAYRLIAQELIRLALPENRVTEVAARLATDELLHEGSLATDAPNDLGVRAALGAIRGWLERLDGKVASLEKAEVDNAKVPLLLEVDRTLSRELGERRVALSSLDKKVEDFFETSAGRVESLKETVTAIAADVAATSEARSSLADLVGMHNDSLMRLESAQGGLVERSDYEEFKKTVMTKTDYADLRKALVNDDEVKKLSALLADRVSRNELNLAFDNFASDFNKNPAMVALRRRQNRILAAALALAAATAATCSWVVVHADRVAAFFR
jgi:hypothetical protein